MKRLFWPRTVIFSSLLTLAYLFLPSDTLAQIIRINPYVQPGDGHSLNHSDVKVIQWFTDQTPGSFIVEYFEKNGLVRTVMPERMALDYFLPPPSLPKKTPPKKEPGKDDKDAAKKEPGKDEPKLKKEPSKDDSSKKKPQDDKSKKEPGEDADKKDDKKDTKGDPKDKAAKKPAPRPDPADRIPPAPEKHQHYYRYTAKLENLPFNSEITYRVKLGNKVIREATFRTRATEERTVRCIMVGDLASGSRHQKEIAHRLSLQKAEFLVALGDITYPTGRINQYMAYFWNTYNNVEQPGVLTGAPIMAELPFYPVLGNHDVDAKLDRKTPDALGAYIFFNPPKNGPGFGPWNTVVDPEEPAHKLFRAATVDSYPYIDTYSFDNGPAHFVVINTNRPLDSPILRKWLLNDLKSTKAAWKIVCFHIPGFQNVHHHYDEQQLRALQPLFEEGGVDLAFGGHVHSYQRSVPLKFTPTTEEKSKTKNSKKHLINGVFTLDTEFDGIKNTQPKGVIHIIAGGGGAPLHRPDPNKPPPPLRKKYGPENYTEFTARMVDDEYSFVVLDMSPYRLDLRALGAKGNEIDRITITKDPSFRK